MENNKKSKFKELVKAYGSYAIVLVCVVAAGVASLFLAPAKEDESESRNQTAIVNGVDQTPRATDRPVSVSKDERISDVLDAMTGEPTERHAALTGDANSTPVPDFTSSSETDKAEENLLGAPVDGEIIWDFAVNELIYSATLDQWTTHCGVDIACKQGDSIRAIADGTVESVYEDDAFGITVVIKHKNGHSSVYSNLAQNEKLIKAGVTVKANQVIATCGNTAKFECADKSHLHFEYHIDGKPVNPHKYVRFRVSDT